MDPVTAAILGLGTVAGGVSSLFAGNQQRNLSLQALMDQRRIAQQQYELQTAGQTDARGNRVYYGGPGVGWVSDATPGTRALLGAEDREKMQQFTQDAPLRREALQRGARQGRALEPATDAAIARLSGPRTDPRQFAGEYALSAGRAAQRGLDDTIDAVGRTAVRTGSTSNARKLTDLARERSRSTQDAITQGALQGRTVGENLRSSEDQRLRGDALGLITGQPSIQPFAPVPTTEPGVSPMGAQVAAGKFDPATAAFAASKLIPGASANPYSQLADAGLFGGLLYDNLRKKSQTYGVGSKGSAGLSNYSAGY